MKLLSTLLASLCFTMLLSAPVQSADADVMQRLERLERLLQSQGLLDMLQQIEAAQQELSSLQGEIEALTAAQYYFASDGARAVTHAKQALEKID